MVTVCTCPVSVVVCVAPGPVFATVTEVVVVDVEAGRVTVLVDVEVDVSVQTMLTVSVDVAVTVLVVTVGAGPPLGPGLGDWVVEALVVVAVTTFDEGSTVNVVLTASPLASVTETTYVAAVAPGTPKYSMNIPAALVCPKVNGEPPKPIVMGALGAKPLPLSSTSVPTIPCVGAIVTAAVAADAGLACVSATRKTRATMTAVRGNREPPAICVGLLSDIQTDSGWIVS
jgi:hypothetical protein